MADKSPWWRSFVGKRRAAARESAREAMFTQQQQAQASQSSTSPQKPSTEAPHASTQLTHPSAASHQSPDAAEGEPPRPFSEKRSHSTDDLEPTFNEMSSRRNLRVSRSGRFKEKKRIRVSLPSDEDERTDKPSAKDGK